MLRKTTIFHVTLLIVAVILTGCMAKKSVTPEPAMTDKKIVRQLAGTVWVAEYIHGKPVVDMSHTSMVFSMDGGVNGSGGCNAFSGNYEIKDGKITFPPLAATMKMCVPALSDQEQRFFKSLAAPQKVTFENGMLILTIDGKEPSVFGPHSTN